MMTHIKNEAQEASFIIAHLQLPCYIPSVPIPLRMIHGVSFFFAFPILAKHVFMVLARIPVV